MQAHELFQKLGSMQEAELLKFIKSSEDFSSKQIQSYLDYIYTHAKPLDLGMQLYDCCGTGGDGANTFNISTATAILASANQIKVCKNGGRSSSSQTGSVDVLEALALNLTASLKTKIKGLEENNLAFYSSQVSAELLAPIKQICRKHKLTSFISLIGPLASPVILEGQILGLGKEKWLGTIIDLEKSLIEQGLRQSAIVLVSEFSDGSRVDELTSASKSQIIILDANKQTEFSFDPQDLGLNDNKEDLIGGKDHQENAEIIRSVLESSKANPRLNTVALNAALIQYLANKDQAQNNNDFVERLGQYFEQNQELAYSGKAFDNFNNLILLYN